MAGIVSWLAIMMLIFLYLITRLPFLVFGPVYYDSFENVNLLKNVTWETLIPIIRSSHQPIHTLYLGLAALVRIGTGLPPSHIYVFFSVVFGLLAVWFWHRVLFRFYGNSRYALWGTMLFLLFPGVWRVSTNILYESLLIAFQAGAMATLLLFLDTNLWRDFVTAIIFFTAAQLVFIGNIASALPIAILSVVFKPKKYPWIATWIMISVVLSLVVDRIVLGSTTMVAAKYTSHAADVISPQGGIGLIMARIIRNIMLITSELVHPLSACVAIFAFWALRKEKKLIIVAGSFLVVSFIMMQYFHGGFVGRIGILVVFPVSLLLGKFCGDRPKVGIALCILLGITILRLGLQQRKTPYIQALIAWKQSTIAEMTNVYVITGAFTRFAFEPAPFPVFIVRDPEHETVQLREFIHTAEKNGGRVFVDISAVTFPYKQPDGWNEQLLSRQHKQGFLANWLSGRCTLRVAHEEDSLPPLIIYEVTQCIEDKQE